MVKDLDKAKVLIVELLKEMTEATTNELVEEAMSLGLAECKDRVPSAIAELSATGKVKKRISREKKGIVWFLA
ncbi:MAG: hypothetical protein ACFFD4_10350 [Candidatus Odinarchaeota archaeon]